jgi:hypothetical protein
VIQALPRVVRIRTPRFVLGCGDIPSQESTLAITTLEPLGNGTLRRLQIRSLPNRLVQINGTEVFLEERVSKVKGDVCQGILAIPVVPPLVKDEEQRFPGGEGRVANVHDLEGGIDFRAIAFGLVLVDIEPISNSLLRLEHFQSIRRVRENIPKLKPEFTPIHLHIHLLRCLLKVGNGRFGPGVDHKDLATGVLGNGKDLSNPGVQLVRLGEFLQGKTKDSGLHVIVFHEGEPFGRDPCGWSGGNGGRRRRRGSRGTRLLCGRSRNLFGLSLDSFVAKGSK